MKKCTICNEEKDLTEYYKGHGKCKKCFIKKVLEKDTDEKRIKRNKWRIDNDYNKKYYALNKEQEKLRKIENKESIKERNRKYYLANKEKFRLQKKQYCINNKDKVRKANKLYAINNRDKLNKLQRKFRIKNKDNLLYKIRLTLKSRVRAFLKSKNLTKNSSTFTMVGMSSIEFKAYLEKQFKDGMSWENYGYRGWHIDHIIPISSANNEEELIKLCHYTNLQPLWAVDNFKKGSKIIQQPLL